MNKGVNIQDLGLKDYKEAWDYQETLFKETIDIKIKNRRESAGLSTPNHLLFVTRNGTSISIETLKDQVKGRLVEISGKAFDGKN